MIMCLDVYVFSLVDKIFFAFNYCKIILLSTI